MWLQHHIALYSLWFYIEKTLVFIRHWCITGTLKRYITIYELENLESTMATLVLHTHIRSQKTLKISLSRFHSHAIKSHSFLVVECMTFVCLADNFKPQIKCAYFLQMICIVEMIFFFSFSVETHTSFFIRTPTTQSILKVNSHFQQLFFTFLHLFFLLLICLELDFFFS